MMVGLGSRLVLIIASVLLFLTISAGVIIDRQLTQAIHEEAVHQVEANAQVLSVALQAMMLGGQATQVRDWLKKMEQQQAVIEAHIFNVDGAEAFTDLNTIAAVNSFLGEPRFSRAQVKSHLSPVQANPDFDAALEGRTGVSRTGSGTFTVYMPIVTQVVCQECHGYASKPILGVMRIVQSSAVIDRRIHSMRERLWLFAIVLVTVITLVLWVLLGRYVLRPVFHLQSAIMRVGEGDRQARLPVLRNDELGGVSRVFNTMQVKLQASEEHARAVTDNVADGIVVADEHGIIESINPAITHIFGYSKEELVGQSINQLMPESYHDRHIGHVEQYKSTGSTKLMGQRRELTGIRVDGADIPIDITLSEMKRDGRLRFIAIIRDRSEQKRQIDILEHQALHDGLTGLPNRNLLMDRIELALRTAQREERPLALLIADLDRFKEINDTLGHLVGDQVLIQVAEHLQQVVRQSDTVARLGGDEFALLLPTAACEDALNICRKLVARLEQPIEMQGQTFSIGISIGVAMFPDHGVDVTTLMQRADVAMYAAKRTHSGFIVYDPDQDEHSLESLSLVNDLRTAIEQDQLVLYYQPVIDLRTHTVSGVEALIRWQHPRHGLLQPDDFIPLAERTGLIRPLTAWVLDSAAAQTQQWAQQGIELRVAVNLSAHNLHDANFQDQFIKLIDKDRPALPRLRLEITESTIMSGSQRVLETMNQLSARGVRISIDDFGTGYSSLMYLKRLPVDELKIDRSFVTHMVVDENDTVIVRSTIDMAHNMGLKVVAEGVEDEATYQLLTRLHCDLVQGFHISHPLSAAELMKWMQRSRWQLPG